MPWLAPPGLGLPNLARPRTCQTIPLRIESTNRNSCILCGCLVEAHDSPSRTGPRPAVPCLDTPSISPSSARTNSYALCGCPIGTLAEA
jgi:hypothetical protein